MDVPAAATSSPRYRARPFLGHLLEMVAAMLVAMAVLGVIVWAVFDLLGHADLRHVAGVRAFVMTVNMVVGMSVWMRYRRHGWAAVGEMAVAMCLPYAVLIGPYLAGLVSGPAFLGATHVLMLPMMIAAMLHRPEEYRTSRRR